MAEDKKSKAYYDKLGLAFQTYKQWIASGARVPAGTGMLGAYGRTEK